MTAESTFGNAGSRRAKAAVTPLMIKAFTGAPGEARESVLMTADRALSRFGLRADAPLEDLLVALQGGDSYQRELAAEILGERGSDAASALRLLRLFEQPTPIVCPTQIVEGLSHVRMLRHQRIFSYFQRPQI